MSLLIYTIADANRAAAALHLTKALTLALGNRAEVGILDVGLTPIQQEQARAGGVTIGEVPRDPNLQWPGPGHDVFWLKYRPTAVEGWRHVDRFVYVDSDVVLTREGLAAWVDLGLVNQGFTGVRQPSTWYHLLRGHAIDDDQGLGKGLFEPIICASMWAATRELLIDLEAALIVDLVAARANDWKHWADEAALNRVLRAPDFIQSHPIHVLDPTWFWMGGLGFTVLTPAAARERKIAEACPSGAGILCTPSGDPVYVCHFGEPDAADALVKADPSRLIPFPYCGRNGSWYPKSV